MIHFDTITAIATPNGNGAIAIIRISGSESFNIIQSVFLMKNSKLLSENEIRALHYGNIKDNSEFIDEVMVAVFKAPHSFSGEDSVEIYCHGSIYIQKRILELIIEKGARIANPGEFSQRAFLNGRMDLSQAEAVADLIASTSKASHQIAINQMRGGFSNVLKQLREKLLTFSALLELELDFSEEDVEFANRPQLKELLYEINNVLINLLESFKLGNVIKNGIPVAIVGKPNVGKSTLLNSILNEERAIVSHIPGTTRDTIEDTFIIDGITFRFIDTAGLRNSDDEIENLGIERTYQKIEQALIVLFMVDIAETSFEDIIKELNDFKEHITDKDKKFIIIINKIDLMVETPNHFRELIDLDTIFISAKRKENISMLKDMLLKSINIEDYNNSTILTNTRHYDSLFKAQNAVEKINLAFDNKIPTDLIAIDIKDVLYHIGSITGEVTNKEILGAIFSKFCVGK